MQELIDTERDYVRDLGLIVEVSLPFDVNTCTEGATQTCDVMDVSNR